MTINETEPRLWPNNVETTMQVDRRGQAQTPIMLDSDDNLLVGVNDARIINFTKSPADFWRLKVGSDFNQNSLPPEFSSSVNGSGSIFYQSPGKLGIRTGGGAIGSGGKIWMNNAAGAINFDTRLYFIVELPVSGNFDLKFGAASMAGGNYETSMFRRNEAGTPSNWQGFTQNAAGSPIATTGSYGVETVGGVNYATLRRCGLIWMKETSIEYYVGDKINNFQLIATHNSHLPANDSPLVPFVSFYSDYAIADRTVLIDSVWLSASA